MENRGFLILLLLGLGLVPINSYAYSPESTHAALTEASAKLFNLRNGSSLADDHVESIITGSIEEDSPSYRVLTHFYDPVYNRGLVFGKSWQSSREWAEDNFAQASLDLNYSIKNFAGLTYSSYFGGSSDFSWQRSIYEYAWGDKNRGLKGLGHILHLIQDATVPDHTRNDHHFPYLEAQLHDSSPYEQWTANFNRSNFNLSPNSELNNLPSLRAYFDDTATYSNKNFFSRHTIFSDEYVLPQIIEEKEEETKDGIFTYIYSVDKNEKYKLAAKKLRRSWKDLINENQVDEFIITDPDNKILLDYWRLLSEKAVVNGAGVIKLFFDEVEKEKKTKVLYEKNRSRLAKKVDEFKTGSFVLASLLYGSSVTQEDLSEESEPTSEQTSLEEKAESVAVLAEIVEAPSPAPPEAVFETPLLEASTEAPASETSASITPEEPETETLPEILPPPVESRILGGGGAGIVETPLVARESGAIPTISLSIDECSASLATDGCLITGATLTISWSSSSTDIARYEIECEVAGTACLGFSFNEHGTSTIYAASDGAAYTFRAQSISEPGNRSVETSASVTVNSRPVIINEVAWMGTSASQSSDEWIELKNTTAFSINLSQWVLYSETDLKPYLNLTGTIAANGYYLIERTDDTATNVTADLTAAFGSGTGTGLSNSGEVLVLAYASSTIDRTPALCSGGWCGGNTTNYQTMERYDPNALGTLSSNWGTNSQAVMNGANADANPISGTPRARNSLHYRIILSSDTALTASKTLSFGNSPYVISGPMSISSGATLTVEPGVVIKFTNNGELTVHGTLSADGNSLNRITFTSIKDDTAGSDTNNDGGGTTPAKGDWKKISFMNSGSLLDYADVRYGGHFLGNSASESRAMIYASNASVTITNSTIEKSYNIGVSLQNATSSVISGNTIRNNDSAQDPGFAPNGISIGGGGGIVISNNTFEANRTGIDISNSSPELTNNAFLSHLYRAISLNQGSAGTTFSGNSATNNPFNGIDINESVSEIKRLSANLPYTGILNVQAAGSLTIPAGTILKNVNLTASGALNIEGSSSSRVVFTATTDDAHGGDSDNNGDNSATCSSDPNNVLCPQPGAWSRITLSGSTSTSTINNALIRYGNSGVANGAIYINGGRAEIQNTTVEYSQNQGIQITSSGIASVSASTFRNNDTGLANDGSLSLAGSTFRNNTTGLASPVPSTFIDGGGNDIDSSNTTRTTPATLLP